MQLSDTLLLLIVAAAASSLSAPTANAFVGVGVPSTIASSRIRQQQSTFLSMSEDESQGDEEEPYVKPENPGGRPDFSFSFEIPKKGIADIGSAEVNLPPLLEKSDIIVVRYALPFGLNAEPQADYQGSGVPQIIVTKVNAAKPSNSDDARIGEGEQVGDILRQTTYWRGKNPGLFDVSKNADNFDLVIQALVTNDLMVADEIVLVFERPL